MIALASVASLVAYSIVASQPLAYMVFLRDAQRALTAPAYIELRQRINAVMDRRIPVIYLGTATTVLSLLVLALRGGKGNLVAAAAVALVCLVIDAILMVRRSVPINAVMDRWSPTSHPDDWADYRAKWLAVLTRRQVALLVGFTSLVVGAVSG